jgi:hypothetical protein
MSGKGDKASTAASLKRRDLQSDTDSSHMECKQVEQVHGCVDFAGFASLTSMVHAKPFACYTDTHI